MRITPMPYNFSPKVVELRDPNGKLIQKTVQHTEDGPIEILFPMPRLTAEAVAKTHPWQGLTEKEQDEVFKTFKRSDAYKRDFLNRIASAIEDKLKEKNT